MPPKKKQTSKRKIPDLFAESTASTSSSSTRDSSTSSVPPTRRKKPRTEASKTSAVHAENNKATEMKGEILPIRKDKKKKDVGKFPVEDEECRLYVESEVVDFLRLSCLRGQMGGAKVGITLTDAPKFSGMKEPESEMDMIQTSIDVQASLPCLTRFIFKECERATKEAVARDHDGAGAALTTLGCLLSMCEQPESLSALLFLACPACRWMAPEYTFSLLKPVIAIFKLALLTGRMSATELGEASVADVLESFGISSLEDDEERGNRRNPTHLIKKCPCGTCHFQLAVLLSYHVTAPHQRVKILTEFTPGDRLRPFVDAGWDMWDNEQPMRHNSEASHSSAANPRSGGRRRRKRNAASEPINITQTSPDISDISLCLQGSFGSSALNANIFAELLSEMGCGTDNDDDGGVADEATIYASLSNATHFLFQHPVGHFTITVHFVESPRNEGVSGYSDRQRFYLESLITFVQISNHISKLRGSTVKQSSCGCKGHEPYEGSEHKNSPFLWKLLESHTQFLTQLRAHREESQLSLPRHPQSDRYTTGLNNHFVSLNEMAWNKRLVEMVNVAAHITVDAIIEGEEAPPPIPSDVINANLKSHQLRNLQWMHAREQNPVCEYVEIPVLSTMETRSSYGVDTTRVGTIFYNATCIRYVFVRPEEERNAFTYAALRRPVRGGFLGDDVGLGKTLVLLTLCALDRHEGGRDAVTSPTTTNADATSQPECTTAWDVVQQKVSGRDRHMISAEVLSPRLAGMLGLKPYPVRRDEQMHHLCHTTLVVVPLSIAGQWIDEIKKFYPSARYILYYGSRRNSYTMEDLGTADFVITTYETISTHLRKEVAPGNYFLHRILDKSIPEAVAQRWAGCTRGDVQKAREDMLKVLTEATSTSADASPFKVTYCSPKPRWEVLRSSEMHGNWEMKQSTQAEGDGSITVTFFSPLLKIKARATPSDASVSPTLLDAIGDFMDTFISIARGPFFREMILFDYGWSDFVGLLHKSRFSNVDVRREFVRCIWIPMLQNSIHSLSKDCTASSSPANVYVTDIMFGRLIFDEVQKCGDSSLFHLLQGQRKWVVSGTPINNNKAESLSAPLRILGAGAASRVMRGQWFVHSHATHMNHFNLGIMKCVAIQESLGTNRTVVMDGMTGDGCLCLTCCLVNIHGYEDRPELFTSEDTIPYELQWKSRQFPLENDLPCSPGVIMQTLLRFVIRHERTDSVSADLQLTPVTHVTVPVNMLEDERQLYAHIATIVSTVLQRFHRQGVLTRKMGIVLQWLQNMCRLCLHPTIVTGTFLGVTSEEVLTTDMGMNEGGAEHAVAALASFTAVTPGEALQWIRSEEAAPRIVRGVPQRVPQDTADTMRLLAEIPPVVPSCSVCLDLMADPTVLTCFHVFCKECVLGVIQNSTSAYSGNNNAKCPHCRNKESMLDVKRVVTLVSSDDAVNEELVREEQTQSQLLLPEEQHDLISVEERVARIGIGSRVVALERLLMDDIWAQGPQDGVLVFSKYPHILHKIQEALLASRIETLLIDGATTLARRRKILSTVSSPAAVVEGQTHAHGRVLLVSSRAANAGMNLTFANHIIFVEPNINPALEMQAIGRIHRFGQLKPVKAYHLYAPGTIEEVLYRRSQRILQQQAVAEHIPDEQQGTNGRVNATEALRFLQYPIVQS